MITLVAAAAENNAIGKDNKLLWHLPNDLKFFKNYTLHKPIIMGRKTFDSIGRRALPNRRNIIISRELQETEGVEVFDSLQKAIEACAQEPEICIAGGEQIYRQSMDIATDIRLTRVHASPEGDTFFPEIPSGTWKLESREAFGADEKHRFSYSFEHYKRF